MGIAAAACGPSAPSECWYNGNAYEYGESFESEDGCMAFVCEQGIPEIVRDDTIEVDGDLDLPSQEDVDGMTCLTVVDGDVMISGTAADLTPIRTLRHISGGLTIAGSDAVTLDGLEGLWEIGQSVTIADNEQLTALGFDHRLDVFGDVVIDNNDALTSLIESPLKGPCTTCAASPETEQAEPVFRGQPGDGGGGADYEPTGPGFYGAIIISDNDALTDLRGLDHLYSAWSDVRIRDNDALADLSTMQLGIVMGDLEVSGHGTMLSEHAQSFADGIDVGGTVTVCGNLNGPACP